MGDESSLMNLGTPISVFGMPPSEHYAAHSRRMPLSHVECPKTADGGADDVHAIELQGVQQLHQRAGGERAEGAAPVIDR